MDKKTEVTRGYNVVIVVILHNNVHEVTVIASSNSYVH